MDVNFNFNFNFNFNLKCINEQELKAKGLIAPPIQDIFLEEVDFERINRHTVLIYDTLTHEFTYHTVRVPRTYEKEIWLITENSYTDNLDNETFTYFKFTF